MTTVALTHNPAAANAGAAGYGPIRHTPLTRRRVADMVAAIGERGEAGQGPAVWEILHAADRVASAAMWLVVHETYARRVYLDGRALAAEDFKPTPEGHTGGGLNKGPRPLRYTAGNPLTRATPAPAR